MIREEHRVSASLWKRAKVTRPNRCTLLQLLMLTTYSKPVHMHWYRYDNLSVDILWISAAFCLVTGRQSSLNSFPFCSTVLEPDFHLKKSVEKTLWHSVQCWTIVQSWHLTSKEYIGFCCYLYLWPWILVSYDWYMIVFDKICSIWLTWTSLSLSADAIWLRSVNDKYFLAWNSRSSSSNCSLVNAVRRRRVFPCDELIALLEFPPPWSLSGSLGAPARPSSVSDCSSSEPVEIIIGNSIDTPHRVHSAGRYIGSTRCETSYTIR